MSPFATMLQYSPNRSSVRHFSLPVASSTHRNRLSLPSSYACPPTTTGVVMFPSYLSDQPSDAPAADTLTSCVFPP